MGDHRGDRDRPVPGDVVGDGAEFGKRAPRDRLDEDVQDAAAGEPDREGVVVADAVALAAAARRRRTTSVASS